MTDLAQTSAASEIDIRDVAGPLRLVREGSVSLAECPSCGVRMSLGAEGTAWTATSGTSTSPSKTPSTRAPVGLVKLVTAFQRFAEAMHDALPSPKETPDFNAFQRLADGSRL